MAVEDERQREVSQCRFALRQNKWSGAENGSRKQQSALKQPHWQ